MDINSWWINNGGSNVSLVGYNLEWSFIENDLKIIKNNMDNFENMNYDQEIEKMYHPENFEEYNDED